MVKLSMPIGVSRKLGSRERDWPSLASLAERRRSSVTQTTLDVFNATSLGECASSRTRKSLMLLKTVQKWWLLTNDNSVLEVAKDHQILLLQIQKILSHDRPHHEQMQSHSRLTSGRIANPSLLDRPCAAQHQSRKPTTQSASELATLTSPQLHQRLHLDSQFKRQRLLLILGWILWSPTPLTTT